MVVPRVPTFKYEPITFASCNISLEIPVRKAWSKLEGFALCNVSASLHAARYTLHALWHQVNAFSMKGFANVLFMYFRMWMNVFPKNMK